MFTLNTEYTANLTDNTTNLTELYNSRIVSFDHFPTDELCVDFLNQHADYAGLVALQLQCGSLADPYLCYFINRGQGWQKSYFISIDEYFD